MHQCLQDGGWNWSQLKLEVIFNFHCFVSQPQRNNSGVYQRGVDDFNFIHLKVDSP